MFFLGREFTFHIIQSFATRGLVTLLGLGFSVLAARELGPEGRGVIALALLVPILCVSMGSLGIAPSLAHHLGKKILPASSAVGAGLLIATGGSLIGIAVTIVAYRLQALAGEDGILLLAGASVVPLGIFGAVARGILMSRRAVLRINLANLVNSAARLGLFAAMVIGISASPTWAVIATGAGFLVYLLVLGGAFTSVQLAPRREILQATIPILRKSFFFGTVMLILQLNYRIDILMLQLFVSVSDIGQYAVGVNYAEILLQVPTVVGFVVLTHSASSANSRRFSAVISRMLLRIVPILMLFAASLAWVAPYGLTLVFGDVYHAAVPVAWILLPSLVLLGAAKIVTSDLVGRGRPKMAILSFAGALFVNVVLNVILIPKFGFTGAAMATGVGYAVGSGGLLIAYRLLIISDRNTSEVREQEMDSDIWQS